MRIGTVLSERGFAQFTGLKLVDKLLDLSVRFRPAAYLPDRAVHLVTVFVGQEQVCRTIKDQTPRPMLKNKTFQSQNLEL